MGTDMRNTYSDWYRYRRENDAYRAIIGRGRRSNDRPQEYAREECECGARCDCQDDETAVPRL